MDRAIPPSPAPSVPERSFAGLHEILQHEDTASHPNCPATSSDIIQFVPRTASDYPPELPDTNEHLSLNMAYTQPHQGLPFSYPSHLSSDDTGAYEADHATSAPQTYNLNTPEASPPTPSQQLSADVSAPGTARTVRATQGTKVLAVKSGRVEKSSPSKKKANSLSASPPTARKEKSTRAKSGSANAIEEPLSVLTKDWDTPFVDIDAYVRRSVDERRQEVDHGKVPGKVKRAMNAFMLYRKAYQDRAKKWAQQSNHQVVSKVCGQSWSMEPETVRRQFNDWAVIERDNHRKAHPEYKFTPSKPRKKGKEDFEDESEQEDPEWDNHGHLDATYRAASRTSTNDPRGAAYVHSYAPAHVAGMPSFPPFHHRSNPGVANLAGHAPTPYDADEFVSGAMGHYRQVPTGHQQHLGGVIFPNALQHSIHISNAPHSSGRQSFGLGSQYPQQAPAVEPQLLGEISSHAPPHLPENTTSLGQQIDPSLVARDGTPQYDLSNPVPPAAHLNQSSWPVGLTVNANTSELYSGPYFEIDESFVHDTNLQYFRGGEESWRIGPSGEADNWHQMGEL